MVGVALGTGAAVAVALYEAAVVAVLLLLVQPTAKAKAKLKPKVMTRLKAEGCSYTTSTSCCTGAAVSVTSVTCCSSVRVLVWALDQTWSLTAVLASSCLKGLELEGRIGKTLLLFYYLRYSTLLS